MDLSTTYLLSYCVYITYITSSAPLYSKISHISCAPEHVKSNLFCWTKPLHLWLTKIWSMLHTQMGKPYLLSLFLIFLSKWENLELGTLERRRLAFSVLLHVVGIGCVVWSLYVLVERAAQEVAVSFMCMNI